MDSVVRCAQLRAALSARTLLIAMDSVVRCERTLLIANSYK